MLKIMCVVGVRPNFVKLAGMIDALKEFEVLIVHTGQHYDNELNEEFWEDLKLPNPNKELHVIEDSHVYQLTVMMERLLPVIGTFKPDAVMVFGDANSTLAGALTANKMGVDVIHVEAGLRSFDDSMPEEINRRLIDVVSSLLFVTETAGVINLGDENLGGSTYFVGNVMIDAMMKNKNRIGNSNIVERLGLYKKDYILCTLHRPSNVDEEEKLDKIEKVLLQINKECQVVLPLHPRSHLKELKTCPPMIYTDFIKLLSCAKMVITDSGGVQEEALIVQTPCLTLRDSTERPVTLISGANFLVRPEDLYAGYKNTLKREIDWHFPDFWDGMASQRIAKTIKNYYGDKP